MTQRDSIILLIVATVLVSWMAEILVHSVESAAEDFGLPHLFIGVILLPLFGNAAEHFTAVTVLLHPSCPSQSDREYPWKPPAGNGSRIRMGGNPSFRAEIFRDPS